MTQKTQPIHIVILGGGFAGVNALRTLAKLPHTLSLRITLVSNSKEFTFTPMIHEVATGLLVPSSISQDIASLVARPHTQVVHAEITGIDYDQQFVHIRYPDHTTITDDTRVPAQREDTLNYDYLVSALGSVTNFFGVPGASDYSLELKTLDDAKKIKNHIIQSFEYAQTLADPEEQRKQLRFVIVGGGPTGVELAGELSDFTLHELGKAFPQLKHLSSIFLIDRGTCLVGNMDCWFGHYAERILNNKGNVYVLHETGVKSVSDNGVEVPEGLIQAKTVIWTAGVKAVTIPTAHAKPIAVNERDGRVEVTRSLHIPSYPNVFVAGDQARVEDIETKQPYPMRAQFAVRQGTLIGKNIYALLTQQKLKEFQWKDRGFILSLGRGGGLAEVWGVRWRGPFAWWIYRTAYLMSIVGIRAKLRTALEWTMNLFLPRDIGKV